MSRSLTVSVPPPALIARWLGWLVLGVVVIVAGVIGGQTLTRRDSAVALAASTPLQQIQTSSGVYLGKIVSADDNYLRIFGPAVLRENQPSASGQPPQLLVIRLTSEPFDLDGDVLIPRENVILIGNVARNSPLETAYRQAIGDLPAGGEATPSPQPSLPGPSAS